MSVKKLLDLTGRIALVTGGSRGLGLQIAEGLGEMGAKLALTARKADELDEAREHLAGQGIAADSPIARAVERELWPSRHPTLHWMLTAPRRLAGGVRDRMGAGRRV